MRARRGRGLASSTVSRSAASGDIWLGFPTCRADSYGRDFDQNLHVETVEDARRLPWASCSRTLEMIALEAILLGLVAVAHRRLDARLDVLELGDLGFDRFSSPP